MKELLIYYVYLFTLLVFNTLTKTLSQFWYSHLPLHSSNNVNQLHLARDFRFLAADDSGRHR